MTLRTLTSALMMLALTVPTPTLHAQSSSSGSVTLNAEQLAEVVDGACGEARVLADASAELRIQRDEVRAQRDECLGALSQMQGVDEARVEYARESAQMRVWVVVGVVLGFVGGLVGGYAVGQL